MVSPAAAGPREVRLALPWFGSLLGRTGLGALAAMLAAPGVLPAAVLPAPRVTLAAALAASGVLLAVELAVIPLGLLATAVVCASDMLVQLLGAGWAEYCRWQRALPLSAIALQTQLGIRHWLPSRCVKLSKWPAAAGYGWEALPAPAALGQSAAG